MRSLYKILESIVDIYHEIFGDVVESSSKVTKSDKWLALGFIDEDNIVKDDFKGTCKNMEKRLKSLKLYLDSEHV